MVRVNGSTVIKNLKSGRPLEPAPRPRQPAATQFARIRDSIILNLEYLAATTPPFQGGKLASYESGQDTYLWKIYEPTPIRHQRVDDGIRGSGYTLVQFTHTTYYFDAHGNLVVHVYRRDSGSTARNRGIYQKINEPNELPVNGQVLLLVKLREMRLELEDRLAPVPSR